MYSPLPSHLTGPWVLIDRQSPVSSKGKVDLSYYQFKGAELWPMMRYYLMVSIKTYFTIHL